MDKVKIFVASALFILLTALKLLFPGELGVLRREADRLMATGKDYRGTVEAIGRCLSDRSFGEKLAAVFREYAQEETEERT